MPKKLSLNVVSEKTKKVLVYDYLKEMIITDKLHAGSLLVERQICEMLNTSRTPIREAIQQLANDGLVENIPSKGCFVSSVSYEDISQLYDVREYLESLAVKLCCQNATPQQLDNLQDLCTKMRYLLECEEIEQYYMIDTSFHIQIVSYSRNAVLVKTYGTMTNQIRRITRMCGYSLDDIMSSHKYHERVLEAIKQRDSALAESIIREHISKSKLLHMKQFSPDMFHAAQQQ